MKKLLKKLAPYIVAFNLFAAGCASLQPQGNVQSTENNLESKISDKSASTSAPKKNLFYYLEEDSEDKSPIENISLQKFEGIGIEIGALMGIAVNYSPEIQNRTVTALNGKSAEIKMPISPFCQDYIELNLDGIVGIKFPIISSQRIASYRYFYADPTKGIDNEDSFNAENTEVAYVALKRYPFLCFSLLTPIFSRKNDVYLKMDLSAGPIAIVQGTEAWGEDMNESTIHRDWLLNLGIGIFYFNNKSNYVGIELNKSTTVWDNTWASNYSIGGIMGIRFAPDKKGK